MIIFVSNDLIFFSKLKSYASQKDVAIYSAGNVERFSDLAVEHPQLVFLDLTSVGLPEIPKWVELIRAKTPSAKLIAFAGHVKIQLIEAAKAAGVDQTLSNGQLNQKYGEIIDQLKNDSPSV